MRYQSIWKGITIFSLALGIGTFTGDFFGVKELPENIPVKVQTVENPIQNQTPEKRNCRFADPDLKYQTLPLKDEKFSAELLSKPTVLDKSKEKKRKVKESQKDIDKELEKQVSELRKKLNKAYKTEEYSTLLHKELCYESDGRK